VLFDNGSRVGAGKQDIVRRYDGCRSLRVHVVVTTHPLVAVPQGTVDRVISSRGAADGHRGRRCGSLWYVTIVPVGAVDDALKRRGKQATAAAADDSVAGPEAGHIQNRRQPGRGPSLGTPQEPARNELRQTIPEPATILQKGHHAQDGSFPTARVPVLSSVQRLTKQNIILEKKMYMYYYYYYRVCVAIGVTHWHISIQ